MLGLNLPEFRAVNRFATATRALCFVACDVVALVAADPLRIDLPIVFMVGPAMVSRRLARHYLTRRLGVASDLLTG